MTRFLRIITLSLFAILGFAPIARAAATTIKLSTPGYFLNEAKSTLDMFGNGYHSYTKESVAPNIAPYVTSAIGFSASDYPELSYTVTDAGRYVDTWCFYKNGSLTSLRASVTGHPKSYRVTYDYLSTFSLYESAYDLVPLLKMMSYNLSYSANGGSWVAQPANLQNVSYPDEITIAASTTIQRPGYGFAGWNTQSDGLGMAIEQGQTCTGGQTLGISADSVDANGHTNITLYAQWEANSYNVELSAADADPSSGHTTAIEVTYDQTPSKISKCPTRTYWKFAGYYTEQEGEGDQYFDGNGNATRKWQVTNVTRLYAHWVRYKCTITFSHDGPGSVNVGGSKEYNSGDVVAAKATSDSNAVFLRWSDGETMESHSDITVVSNATYTAYFATQVYTLTFRYTNTKKKLVAVAQEYQHGALVVPPTDVKRETGYTWEWDPTPPVYAYENNEFGGEYVANHYQIQFEGNGAQSGSVDAVDAIYDEERELPPNKFARAGYSFVGWDRNPTATDAEYADGALVSNLSAEENGTVTLYAIWSPNAYKVRFNKGQDTATGTMDDQTFTYDKEQALAKNAFAYAGQVFEGWAMSLGGAVAYADGATVSNLTTEADAVVNLYAVWSNYHYVRFDPNTNDLDVARHRVTGVMTNEMFSGAEEKPLLTNAYGKVGYTFAGWATNLVEAASCRTNYTDGQIASFPEAQPNETNVLYAVWSTNRYTIAFDPGTDLKSPYFFGTMAPLTNCAYDTAITITCGYTNYCSQGLLGWSTNALATTPDFAVTETSPVSQGAAAIVSNLTAVANATQTLYAVWADAGELSAAAGLTNAVLVSECAEGSAYVAWWPVTNYTVEAGHPTCVAMEKRVEGKPSAVRDQETGKWNLKMTVVGSGRLSHVWYWKYGNLESDFTLNVDSVAQTNLPRNVYWSATNSVWISGVGVHEIIWEFDGTINIASKQELICVDDIVWTPGQTVTPGTEMPTFETQADAEAAASSAQVVPPNEDVADACDNANPKVVYNDMFVTRAVPNAAYPVSSPDPWTLAVELKESVSNEVQAVLDVAETNLAEQVRLALAGGDLSAAISVNLATKAGLYYGIAATNEVAWLSLAAPTNWILGEGRSQALSIGAPAPEAGFFEMRATATPPAEK